MQESLSCFFSETEFWLIFDILFVDVVLMQKSHIALNIYLPRLRLDAKELEMFRSKEFLICSFLRILSHWRSNGTRSTIWSFLTVWASKQTKQSSVSELADWYRVCSYRIARQISYLSDGSLKSILFENGSITVKQRSPHDACSIVGLLYL